jgi:hypothetical protein
MKKGKARQHFFRSTRLESERSGQDLSFLDEGQESLPDESRSEDLFAEDINQDFVDSENTDLPIGGNNLGTGSGQLMSDHGNADFGEIDRTDGTPMNVITVGVLPDRPVSLPTQPTHTELISPNNALSTNASTVSDTARRVNFDDGSSSQKSQNPSVVLPSGRHGSRSSATFTNPQSTSNSGVTQASNVGIVSQETERIRLLEESMKRMENMISQSFNFMQEQQQARISGNMATPQQETSSSSRVPQQVTTERISAEDRLVEEEELQNGGHRTSLYPDVRDIHRRNSPMNYFDYSSENTRYLRQDLMNEGELPSRNFENLEDDFVVPPYQSSGVNNFVNQREINGPSGPTVPSSGGGRVPSGGISPYDEYTTLPIHRMLTYSQPVESYTGKKLYNLEVGTILKFAFEFSDYVAVMRQAALPIHNYMGTSAKQELLSTALARRWGITSQIQFNGLNTGKVMKLLQVKVTPRSLNEFYYSLKDNTEFPAMGEVEITLSNFNKFYDAYQKCYSI